MKREVDSIKSAGKPVFFPGWRLNGKNLSAAYRNGGKSIRELGQDRGAESQLFVVQLICYSKGQSVHSGSNGIWIVHHTSPI